jgi:2-polyprenyl-3-methyl-5-hydroxy-6-metoxy-1,4-benzoquinol methylase
VNDVLAREGFPDRVAASASAPISLRRVAPPVAVKLMVPIWGYQHVRQFLETSLPTLLAPGNVPALASALDCEFIVLTSEEDRDYIREHAGFKRLSQTCRTEIRLIDHLITDGNHSTTITIAYTEVVRSAGATMVDTCFFFLVSDYIVADGSFRSALERMMRGASAVVVGNFQVDEAESSPWLQERLRANRFSLSLTPRELMHWALKHLHPATIANTVNIPLSHNSHTNRLFWRVDGTTMLGRFYLMHMLCVRPERTDFHIGASCDYSFVPEMCPSGNVDFITDSDDYLVIEMQPRGHESIFLRPGSLTPKVLARSLAEWATATHRANAHRSLIFHAEDVPPGINQSIAEASALVKSVEHMIRREPQPHRGHPYWQSAIASFYEATGRKIDKDDRQYVLDTSMSPRGLSDWLLWRAKSAVLGQAPHVFPWHPAWMDFRLVLQELEPFYADRAKRLLVLSNAPTTFSVALADSGERVRRLRCGPFLQSAPKRYRPLHAYFDLCLLELVEGEMAQGDELIDRIVPLMKPEGSIIVSVRNRRPIGQWEGFGAGVAYHALRFIRPGALPTLIQYVPANPVRWGAYRGLGGLRELASRWPIIGLPLLAVGTGLLILLSGLGNLDRLRRTTDRVPWGICSSFLMRLRVDRRGAVASQRALEAEQTRQSRSVVGEPGDRWPEAATTREPQYARCLDLKEKSGLTSLGLMTNQVWHDDPRRLTFLLARYKFVAKMLSGRRNVAEVGCGDAFGTRIVQQEADQVTVYDFDPLFIEDIQSRQSDRWPLKAVMHDIVAGPLPERYDGVYSLDVLEHIESVNEHAYLANLRGSLASEGVLIIGTPSIESQLYASPPSKAGHVNCKSGKELKVLLERYFTRVFIFSMNDEVVHTGFYPMAHYLFAICSGAR